MDDKVITFAVRKTGRFRWLSYVDFLRLMVYGLRRAGYPVMFSHGFKPKPLYISLQAVPLGVDVAVDVVSFRFPMDFEPLADPRPFFPEDMAPLGWFYGEVERFWGVYRCGGHWMMVEHPQNGLRSILKRLQCEPYDTIRIDVLLEDAGRKQSVLNLIRRW